MQTQLPRQQRPLTQRERRETTIARLVDATISSLLEVGYARTSVKEICTRAGVSHGGLFRHFSSVLGLVMAAAGEVARRQLENAATGLQRLENENASVEAAMHQIRDACRAPINAVFYELITAARTDPQLHAAMVTFSAGYSTAIVEAAQCSPLFERVPPELRLVLLSSALHLFDGEALTRSVMSFPELEEQRMDLLVKLVSMF